MYIKNSHLRGSKTLLLNHFYYNMEMVAGGLKRWDTS